MSGRTSSTFQHPPRRRFAAAALSMALSLLTGTAHAAPPRHVLHDRPLQVAIKDHRSIPARGIRNIEEFAAMPDLVAVFGGRSSAAILVANDDEAAKVSKVRRIDDIKSPVGADHAYDLTHLLALARYRFDDVPVPAAD